MKKLVVGNGEERYEDLTPEEIVHISVSSEAVNDWLHQYPIRINIPWELFFEPQYSIFAIYFVNVQKLPVERVEDRIHGYCNYIEPQFVEMIESDPRIKIEYKDGH